MALSHELINFDFFIFKILKQKTIFNFSKKHLFQEILKHPTWSTPSVKNKGWCTFWASNNMTGQSPKVWSIWAGEMGPASGSSNEAGVVGSEVIPEIISPLPMSYFPYWILLRPEWRINKWIMDSSSICAATTFRFAPILTLTGFFCTGSGT